MRKNVYVTPKSFLCLIDFYKVLYVGALGWRRLGTQNGHRQKHFYGDIPTLLGFIVRGFIWDIPILIFAYVGGCQHFGRFLGSD